MAVTASSVGTGDTLETFRQEFNNAVVDLGNLDSASVSSISISANNSTNETVFLTFVDGATGNQGLESDTGLTYNPSTGLITTATLTTTGLITSGSNIVIADAGTIGSSSDTNAIGISSGGVVSITATTANTSASDGALTVAGGAGIAADLSVGDDLRLISDAAVLSFGADSDVTLTHVADTGILLNSTMAIQFNDASQYINAPSNAILDINATDEIELNATLADVNANLDVSGTYTGGGLMTTGGNIVIPDAGNIGSASDTDAIAISSGGVVTFSQTPIFSGDLQIEDDLILDSDAAVISFGEDNEVTLTHVADTGLLLNSTMQLQFNDASQNINAPSATVLDINATDEIELNATLADVNANLDVSGTYTGGGLMTTGGNIVIPDAGNIGSASDTNAISISSGGVVAVTATTANTSASDGALTVAGGAGVAADLSVGDDLRLISDAAVLSFGADSDVTLTHVADTGILLNSTMAIQFNDASQSINAPSNAILDINATDEIELNATLLDVNANINASGTYTGAGLMTTGGNIVIPDAGNIGSASDTDAIAISSGGVVAISATTANTSASDGALTVAGGLGVAADASIGDDLRLISDGAVLSFGANSEVTMTHVHDTGLTMTHTATGDNTPMVLQLKSEEDAIVANEVIASIEMAAGDSDGTDGATVAAGIHAIAEGTFSASANATKLVFTCGVSETAASSATAKMTLASDGDLTLAGTVTADATATLLIKNSSGSTLKTINGIAAN